MNLVRDVLDKQVMDPEGRHLGKVDGLLLDWTPGRRPRVAALEMSGVTLARRLHPRLGHWAARLARRVSPTRGTPFRIPWDRVEQTGIDVVARVPVEATPGARWERWLAEKVIGRIPGA